MPALNPTVADSLVMDYLEGLPADPKLPGAYHRLRDVLVDLAMSIDHARAALQSFDERFPSPRELKEGLTNLHDRYQPPPTSEEQKAKWLAEGAIYDPEWTKKLLNTLGDVGTGATPEQFRQSWQQAMLDTLWYTEGPGREVIGIDRKFWQDARKHHQRTHAGAWRWLREQMAQPDAWEPYDLKRDSYGAVALEGLQQEEDFLARHGREWRTVVNTWRKEDPNRRRSLYPGDLDIAQLRQRLGFELTPWDVIVLEAAGKRTENAGGVS